MNRDRHATVAQLRAVFAELRDDDVICTDLPPSGFLPVLRDGVQVAVIGMAAQDLGEPLPPEAELEWLSDLGE